MHIDKQQIIDLLRHEGDLDKANEAESVLPVEVDPDQHADLLGGLGLSRGYLLGQLR